MKLSDHFLWFMESHPGSPKLNGTELLLQPCLRTLDVEG
jgi:hypothetical protein